MKIDGIMKRKMSESELPPIWAFNDKDKYN